MPHNVAFHQGLHCLLRQNHIFKESNTIFLEEITACDPSIYTIDHPDFIVCSYMENFIGLLRVKLFWFVISSTIVMGYKNLISTYNGLEILTSITLKAL